LICAKMTPRAATREMGQEVLPATVLGSRTKLVDVLPMHLLHQLLVTTDTPVLT